MKSMVWGLSISAFFTCFAQSAHAEPSALLNKCEEKTQLVNIASPFKEATRTFVNGKIRLWHLNTNGEPTCCSHHLAITSSEPNPETGERFCTQLSMDENDGFYKLSMTKVKSNSDANGNLKLTVPVKYYDTNQDYRINLTVNTQTFSVTINSIE